MRKAWILLCAVWMCISCHYKEKQMAEGMRQLQSKSVDLCTDSMRCLVNGQDTMLFREEKNLKLVMRTYSPDCPIYIDTTGIFRHKNPHIPKNKVFHTFLLDKDNKAVLAGDPLEHPEMRPLYHQAIQQLLKQ